MDVKNVSKMAKTLGGAISKNSPTILTGLAVGGVLTTVIFAVQATPTALTLINDREQELTDMQPGVYHRPVLLTKVEVAKLTWKLYLPAASMGLATIACIIGANSINHKRNAALATVYGLTETAFREYKEKVVETVGKNKEIKIRDEISADKVKSNPPGKNEVIFTGKGEVLCYDSMSGRYFNSDIEQIRRVVNKINKEFMLDMWVSLNDFYYELGLATTKMGDQIGWDLDKGLIEISFSSQLTEDDKPCLVLNYDVKPKFQD